MSGERLLGSFIVRVAVRGGKRLIDVYDVASGSTTRLTDYRDLHAHLAACEETFAPDGPAQGREKERR